MLDLNSKIKEMRQLSFNEAARWGAIVGVAGSLLLVLSYVFRNNGNLYFINSMDFAVFGSLFYFAAKGMAVKRGDYGFGFASAWGFIILVSSFAGVLSGITQYVLMAHVDPNYYTTIYEELFKAMYGIEGDNFITLFKEYQSRIGIIVLASIMGAAFRGAFLGLIVAAFTRNKINPYKGYTKPDEESNTEK